MIAGPKQVKSAFRLASSDLFAPFSQRRQRQMAALGRPAAPSHVEEAPRRTEKGERAREKEMKRKKNSVFENRGRFDCSHQNSSFSNSTSPPFSTREMPPSPPVPSSSELAAEEQKEQAVEQTTSAIESDQAEPIAVDADEEAEEEEGEEEGQAAATTTAAPGGGEETTAAGLDFDFPRSILRRIVKARLNEVAAKELGEGKEFGVSKEALEALGEGAKVRTRSSFFLSKISSLLFFQRAPLLLFSDEFSSESQVFISFITSTANDLCKGAKRQVSRGA